MFRIPLKFPSKCECCVISSLPLLDVKACVNCQIIFNLVKGLYADKTSRAALCNQLVKGCQQLSFRELQAACVKMVYEYLDAWLTTMTKELDPLKTCKLLQVGSTCGTNVAEPEPPIKTRKDNSEKQLELFGK
ncbi:uncharacterized protein DEA37_0001995 [Paragonimus westermani]|uniref:Saposin B-type domain-containing protein n=1 Tax=Paragonimus westermani TaxID=34504 RepID=A0A5J4NV35_9TREM|nr:uncharacterized protein DEA37_0001995 [Paragonimus westermani]